MVRRKSRKNRQSLMDGLWQTFTAAYIDSWSISLPWDHFQKEIYQSSVFVKTIQAMTQLHKKKAKFWEYTDCFFIFSLSSFQSGKGAYNNLQKRTWVLIPSCCDYPIVSNTKLTPLSILCPTTVNRMGAAQLSSSIVPTQGCNLSISSFLH